MTSACFWVFTGKNDDFTEFVKNVAMHIAASSPIAVDSEGIPEDILSKEKEIYETQAKESGKPENVIQKIVEGKIKKFYSDNTLLGQQYVKNPDITIQDLVNEMIAKTGENIKINRFVRFQLGENNE